MLRKEDLRIVFMGTPDFAVSTLRALVESGCRVVAVVTQPDKPVGRHGSVLQAPPVKQYALEHGLPVLQPEKMKDEQFVERLRAYQADLQVVVAFRMLPEVVWAMPRLGTFNVHASLLPQYRGAAPINWAIVNGETTTGVTTFFLDRDIDTGRIIMQRPFDIPDDADAQYVYDGLAQLGAETCLQTIDRIMAADGHPESMAQGELERRLHGQPLRPAPKIFKDTCRIKWDAPSKTVYDFVRGLSPWPGAWTELVAPDGKVSVLKVLRTGKVDARPTASPGHLVAERRRLFAATADGLLELLEVQLAGKRRMAAADFLNGLKDTENYYLS